MPRLRKTAILLSAPVLLALGVAGCHPRPRAQTTLPASDVSAQPATADDGKPPCGCAVKVREPDQVTTTQERVLVSPAGSVDKVIPAVTRTVQKTVVVKPAWTQTIAAPAVYKTVTRTETMPGRSYAVSTPARYRTLTERVLVAPAHTVWRAAHGRPSMGVAAPGQSAYAPTGEVMCAVLVPAKYVVRTRRELVSPAGSRRGEGRAVTRRFLERVQVSPASTRTIEHPAVTKVVDTIEVVTPEHVVTVRTAPVYKLVDRTVRTPRYGWKPAPCAKPKPHAAPRPHHAPKPHVIREQPYVLPLAHGAPYGERG